MRYATIVADPPWDLTLTGSRRRTRGDHGGPALDYKTMSIDEICALQVASIATPEYGKKWLDVWDEEQIDAALNAAPQDAPLAAASVTGAAVAAPVVTSVFRSKKRK
jgi:hypothetical protein